MTNFSNPLYNSLIVELLSLLNSLIITRNQIFFFYETLSINTLKRKYVGACSNRMGETLRSTSEGRGIDRETRLSAIETDEQQSN